MNSKYMKVWKRYYISPDTCFSYEEMKKDGDEEADTYLELAVKNNKYFRHENVEKVINEIKTLLE